MERKDRENGRERGKRRREEERGGKEKEGGRRGMGRTERGILRSALIVI